MNYRIRYYIAFIILYHALISCKGILEYQSLQEAFDNEQYRQVIDMSTSRKYACQDPDECINHHLLVAKSYVKLSQFNQAKRHLESAKKLGSHIDILALEARMAILTQEYDHAKALYRKLGVEEGNPFEYRREMRNAAVLKDWSERESGDSLVHFYSEVSSNLYGIRKWDEEFEIVTSDKFLDKNSIKYAQTGKYDHNIYFLTEGDLIPLENINTNANEGLLTANDDLTRIIFNRCPTHPKLESLNCALYSAEWTGNDFVGIRKISFCDSNYNYIQPYLSSSGDSLFFSSDMPDGIGGFDIYLSTFDGLNWTEPVLLSENINSVGNEKFPFFSGDSLYFSSDEHLGFGGLDIFYSVHLGNSRWTQAMNLLKPINSAYDDFGYTNIEKGEQVGRYMSSSRMGLDAIYRLVNIPNKQDLEQSIQVLDTPSIYLVLEVYEKDRNERIIPGTDYQMDISTNNLLIELSKNNSIPHEYEIETKGQYDISIRKENYFSEVLDIDTRDLVLIPGASDIYIERRITLEPIVVDKEIVLQNIYYDYDKWNIREDAMPALNELAKILESNPEIKIELASHTDCRGADIYNLNLSEKRAESAKSYLLSKGIDPKRINAVGYGEAQPRASCRCNKCDEQDHQENRRTSFKVIEPSSSNSSF